MIRGMACDSIEAFAPALENHAPRLVILNRELADRLGISSPSSLAEIQPGILAVTYSVHVDGDQMFVSTPGGATGYIVKRVKPDRLLEPIIKTGLSAEFPTGNPMPRIKAYFQEMLQSLPLHDNPVLARLSPREREVMAQLSKGCVDKEIAQAMGISVWTVHGHIKKIFERLHVRTRTEAVIRFLEK